MVLSENCDLPFDSFKNIIERCLVQTEKKTFSLIFILQFGFILYSFSLVRDVFQIHEYSKKL